MLERVWLNSFWRSSRWRLSSASFAFLARISSFRACIVGVILDQQLCRAFTGPSTTTLSLSPGGPVAAAASLGCPAGAPPAVAGRRG